MREKSGLKSWKSGLKSWKQELRLESWFKFNAERLESWIISSWRGSWFNFDNESLESWFISGSLSSWFTCDTASLESWFISRKWQSWLKGDNESLESGIISGKCLESWIKWGSWDISFENSFSQGEAVGSEVVDTFSAAKGHSVQNSVWRATTRMSTQHRAQICCSHFRSPRRVP